MLGKEGNMPKGRKSMYVKKITFRDKNALIYLWKHQYCTLKQLLSNTELQEERIIKLVKSGYIKFDPFLNHYNITPKGVMAANLVSKKQINFVRYLYLKCYGVEWHYTNETVEEISKTIASFRKHFPNIFTNSK